MKKLSPKLSVGLWAAILAILVFLVILLFVRIFTVEGPIHGLDAVANRSQIDLPLKMPLDTKEMKQQVIAKNSSPEQKAKQEKVLKITEIAKSLNAESDKKKALISKLDRIQENNNEQNTQQNISDEKKAINLAKRKGKVAIIVKGLGLSQSTTSYAFKLPSTVALGFSPYGYSIDKWTSKATNAGHEVLMGIPMEPTDYPVDDPGPYGLLTSLSTENNIKRLKQIIDRMKNMSGVYSDPGEKFSNSESSFAPILQFLEKQNIHLIYGNRARNAVPLRKKSTLPNHVVTIDFVLDQKVNPQYIREQLANMEVYARDSGVAVAMANPYPMTVEIINDWVVGLEKKGLEIVPISKILEK